MSKKLTTMEFINKANLVCKDKYDYSLVDYIDNRTRVKIVCPEHGIFEQTPNNHLSGKGCLKCGGKEKIDTEEFILRIKQTHGDKYDYSLVGYINSKTKIKIICSKHGIFEQTPSMHLCGHGCSKCSNKNKPTINEFVWKANLIHNYKYDYSLVNYVNNRTKITITCPKHGVFEQYPTNHLRGKGCGKCVGRDKTTDVFISEANIKHGNKYDYFLCKYKGTHKKVKIICPKHDIFEQTPGAHLSGQGCPICKESRGERDIKNFLIEKNIKFMFQKRFKDCRNKKPLPFDFYLPELNTCIEYDGEQHYKPIKYWGGEKQLLYRQMIDKIKTDYCLNKSITLLRIPYNDKTILIEFFKSL